MSVFVSKVRRGDGGAVCDLKWQNGHHKQQQTLFWCDTSELNKMKKQENAFEKLNLIFLR